MHANPIPGIGISNPVAGGPPPDSETGGSGPPIPDNYGP